MVTGICLALGAATSASAAPAPSSTVDEEGTIAHVVAKTTGDAGLQQQDIDCTLSIDNPHQSNTLPSTWNVHLDWKCTGAEPPASLSASPRLYRNGQIVDEPSPTVNHGKRKLRAVANTQCDVAGILDTWYADGQGTVVFPPDYQPAETTLEVNSGNFLQGSDCEPPPALR